MLCSHLWMDFQAITRSIYREEDFIYRSMGNVLLQSHAIQFENAEASY